MQIFFCVSFLKTVCYSWLLTAILREAKRVFAILISKQLQESVAYFLHQSKWIICCKGPSIISRR